MKLSFAALRYQMLSCEVIVLASELHYIAYFYARLPVPLTIYNLDPEVFGCGRFEVEH